MLAYQRKFRTIRTNARETAIGQQNRDDRMMALMMGCEEMGVSV
jgi:hypothetical protein